MVCNGAGRVSPLGPADLLRKLLLEHPDDQDDHDAKSIFIPPLFHGHHLNDIIEILGGNLSSFNGPVILEQSNVPQAPLPQGTCCVLNGGGVDSFCGID